MLQIKRLIKSLSDFQTGMETAAQVHLETEQHNEVWALQFPFLQNLKGTVPGVACVYH